MKKSLIILLGILVLGSMFFSCAKKEEHVQTKATVKESKISHARDNETGEGEEDGTAIAKADKFVQTKKGVKLTLAYNKAWGVFVGSVENVTKETIEKVRIEIHLSNGVELGPTTPIVLLSGETRNIELSAKGQEFESWNTHAEVGSSEGCEGEHNTKESGEHSSGSGEHSSQESGEHD